MSEANYGGKQPNNTAYIKTFNVGQLDDLWKPAVYIKDNIKINILTPSVQQDIYIPRNIYLGGNIIHTSDSMLVRENISPISQEVYDTLMKIEPIQYTLKGDTKIRYNYINRENISSFYLETNPIYISIFQRLEKEIRELKKEISELKKKNDL